MKLVAVAWDLRIITREDIFLWLRGVSSVVPDEEAQMTSSSNHGVRTPKQKKTLKGIQNNERQAKRASAMV